MLLKIFSLIHDFEPEGNPSVPSININIFSGAVVDEQ